MSAFTRKMSSVKYWQAMKYNEIHYKEERNVYARKTVTHCNVALKEKKKVIFDAVLL